MKAIVYDKYGPFDSLRVRDIDKPVLKPNELLVRVHVAALHVGDGFSVKGTPYAMRLATGLLKPKQGIPGFDLAGTVEAAGSDVTRFRPGDEVFGAPGGTCAEYASARESGIALKPANLTFEQAAAVPTAGLAALHGLRDAAKVQPGQHVLIVGASGGVGSLAVQIAKAFGARVTGVCSGANVAMVKDLGADDVIDYTQQDFTRGAERYDVIYDNVENRSLSDLRRVLAPTGTLVLNSGTGAQGLKMMVRLVRPLVLSPFSRQNLKRYLSRPNHDDLVVLKELIEAGKLTPVVDKVYALEDTAAALSYIESGRARGRVVVSVAA